jgi:hypothetical protein
MNTDKRDKRGQQTVKIDVAKILRLPGPPLPPEEGRAIREAIRARMEALPCHGQTPEATRVWMKRHARPGLIVVVRSTLARFHEYVLDEVVEVKPRAGRFYTATAHNWGGTSDGRGWFYFSGQNAKTPTGQVDVVIPTPAVVRAAIGQTERRILSREAHKALIGRAIAQTRELWGVSAGL